MNKKLQILAVALLLQAPIFSMEDPGEIAHRNELFRIEFAQLQTAILKANSYPQVQEYSQVANQKINQLKVHYPQRVQLLESGRVIVEYPTREGQEVAYVFQTF